MSAPVVGNQARARGAQKWGDVSASPIEHEDRLSPDQASEIWDDIFRLFNATSEESRNEVKLAVYGYYAVNGASKRTKHSRSITTGGGVSVIAADVGQAIGYDFIRQFMRADVAEAYSALKESSVLELDKVFTAKAQDKGVPRQFLHCAVDFLRGCDLFTIEELKYVDIAFRVSIIRARNARGGLTVDQEDEETRGVRLEAGRESGSRDMSKHRAGDDF